VRIKHGIEQGSGIAALRPTSYILDCLRDVGFEIEASGDRAATGDPSSPWHGPLTSGFARTGFPNSRAGACLSRMLIRLLETVRLAPPGSRRPALAQWSLVDAGRRRIFTPSFFWVARKRG
jgi:hypothetical protein